MSQPAQTTSLTPETVSALFAQLGGHMTPQAFAALLSQLAPSSAGPPSSSNPISIPQTLALLGVAQQGAAATTPLMQQQQSTPVHLAGTAPASASAAPLGRISEYTSLRSAAALPPSLARGHPPPTDGAGPFPGFILGQDSLGVSMANNQVQQRRLPSVSGGISASDISAANQQRNAAASRNLPSAPSMPVRTARRNTNRNTSSNTNANTGTSTSTTRRTRGPAQASRTLNDRAVVLQESDPRSVLSTNPDGQEMVDVQAIVHFAEEGKRLCISRLQRGTFLQDCDNYGLRHVFVGGKPADTTFKEFLDCVEELMETGTSAWQFNVDQSLLPEERTALIMCRLINKR